MCQSHPSLCTHASFAPLPFPQIFQSVSNEVEVSFTLCLSLHGILHAIMTLCIGSGSSVPGCPVQSAVSPLATWYKWRHGRRRRAKGADRDGTERCVYVPDYLTHFEDAATHTCLLSDCQRHLVDPELRLLTPASRMLQAVAVGCDQACTTITTVVVPQLLQQFHSRSMVR